MDSKIVAAFVVVLVVVVVFALMTRAWKRRTILDRRYSANAPGIEAPALGNADAQRYEVLYVATTRADNALERIAIPGLAFRASAVLLMADHALEIAPRGEVSTVIPAAHIHAISRAQTTIDRVVEKDGLTAIEWTAFDSQVNAPISVVSYFRISSPDARDRCESALRSTFPHATATLKEVSS